MSDDEPSGQWRPVDNMDELRQFPRFRVKGRANVYGRETWMHHAITNLSVGGACLTVPVPSQVGDSIEVELLDYGEVRGMTLACEVKWASERQMGVEFSCGTDNPQVRDYLNATRIEVVPDERDR
ncbi:MAG: PilZ domain-containing protein [Deltaproteobacteria bacterium]|nr:PilZ domain-containing protein [Deltaproteobacteria bacterium]